MSVDPLPAIKAPASTAPDAFNVHHWKCRLSSKSRLWHKRGTLVWIKVSGNVSTGEMKVPAVSRISKIGAAASRRRLNVQQGMRGDFRFPFSDENVVFRAAGRAAMILPTPSIFISRELPSAQR